MVCASPRHFVQARGRRRLGLAFGEWERVPAQWATAVRSLDLLLVPDAFQRDAFRAAGVEGRIEILPIGVDRDYCHPGVQAPRDAQGRCVLLAVVEEFARDAPDRLLAAFQAAFVGDAGVRLLVHVRPGRDAPAIEQALRSDDPRVHVQANWGFPWHQRAQLLCAADIYCSMRRGGGWDPCAAEALACGKLLVATDFGSQAALARDFGIAVATTRVEDARNPGHVWAEPDHDAMVAALREARSRYGRRSAIESAAHAQLFAQAHDIEASADRLAGMVDAIANLRGSRPLPQPHLPDRLARKASGQLVVLGMHRRARPGSPACSCAWASMQARG